MRFDILSNRPAAERAMREDLLKRKYRAKEEQARAATMRAGAATTAAEAGVEEIQRRHPYGLPAYGAETARISARGYAGSAIKGAETAAGRLGLEREESALARKYLFEKEGVGDDISAIKRIATGEEGVAKPGAQECPEGFVWDGKSCVPLR